jgi:hypothetical protein
MSPDTSNGRPAERPPSGRPRLPGWLLNLLLLLFTAIFTTGTVELVLRFAAHRILPGGEWLSTCEILQPDDTLGLRLEPGSQRILITGGAYTVRDRINSLGFRDEERHTEKAPDVRRILILGDSFMFGQGVPYGMSLPRNLAALLPQFEVVNAAVPGYTLGQEYVLYRETGRRFQPDLILLGFFMNDLDETRSLEVTRDPRGVPIAYTMRADAARRNREGRLNSVVGRLSRGLRARSILYSLVRSRLDNLRYWISNPRTEDPSTPEPPTYLHMFLAEPPEGNLALWETAYHTLDALEELVAAGGARLFLFYIPADWQLSDAAMAEWARFYGVDPATLDRHRPQRMLERWASRTGTPFLDLLPSFEGRSREEMYFLHDLHWTPEGHRVATEAVLDSLRRAGLL